MRKPFSVLLKDVGPNRASIVAHFQAMGLSLAESEDLVAQVPSHFIECDEPEARSWAAALSGLGAEVEVISTSPWDFRGRELPLNSGPYDLVLWKAGASTIETLKLVCDIADCSLSDASQILERAPSYLLRGVCMDEAERARERLMELGAEVELWMKSGV